MFHFKTNPKWWLNLIWFLPAFLFLWRKKNHSVSTNIHILIDWLYFLRRSSEPKKKSPRWRCNTCSDSLKQLITSCSLFLWRSPTFRYFWHFWQIYIWKWETLIPCIKSKIRNPSQVPGTSPSAQAAVNDSLWTHLHLGKSKWRWALDPAKEPDRTPREQILSFLSNLFPIWLYLFISD